MKAEIMKLKLNYGFTLKNNRLVDKRACTSRQLSEPWINMKDSTMNVDLTVVQFL